MSTTPEEVVAKKIGAAKAKLLFEYFKKTE